MMDGKSFAVQFKDLRVKTIKNLRTDKYARIGRLLTPFSTRVQQRYSSYSTTRHDANTSGVLLGAKRRKFKGIGRLSPAAFESGNVRILYITLKLS
jgi:hypothetical protein